MSLDPVKPYLPVIALALLAGLLLGGCHWGRAIERSVVAEKMAKKDTAIAKLKGELAAAEDALRAAAAALRAQNLANQQYLAERQRAQRDADAAKVAATAARQRFEAQAASFDQRLQRAARRPDCATLLAMDVGAICGL